MKIILLIALAIINIPVYGILGMLFFGRRGGFREALGYLFIPSFISAVRGEFWDDLWAKERFILWAALCVLVVISEYQLIQKHLPFLLSLFS